MQLSCRKQDAFVFPLSDRDTLFIREYKLNILFVIYAYASEEDYKILLRNTIRQDILRFLNDNYELYKIEADYVEVTTPHGKVYPTFLSYFYHILKGKIYKTEEYGEYILAFEKHPKDPDAKSKILTELSPYLKKQAEQFELQDTDRTMNYTDSNGHNYGNPDTDTDTVTSSSLRSHSS